ncbi:DNA ligase D, partial [Cribrihabitans sp. XS_ASV171]
KRADTPYKSGRGTTWIKSKCIRRAEFVVIGWSPSDKRSRPFSSLLLGSYEGGELIYRGRVGTGFDSDDLDALKARLDRLGRKTAPVSGELPSETKGAQWVTPKLVAEVAYTEFTAEGRIRHGVFHGLREDKEAKDVSAKAEAETDSDSEDAKIEGVRISSAGRVVYPGAGVTKGDIARHYALVAERFLDHAADRPVSLLRCPSGIEDECFFQKHAGKGFPGSLGTVAIEEKDGETADYIYLRGTDAVLGAVQMGTLEFPIWGAARDKLEKPDRMVFDLDPDKGLGFEKVKEAAFEIRDALDVIGLEAAAMVTGGKGIHVIVPLRRTAGWDTVKGFAQTFSHVLAERHPDRYTATMSKAKRKGRIFLDWLRNERGATAIAPYSLRARSGAPVAVPVEWDELETLATANGFTPKDMEDRLSHPCPLSRPDLRSIGKSVVAALEDWANDR